MNIYLLSSVYWCLLTLIADFAQGVQMICENGYKPGSHYYHLGDGRYAYHVSDDTWGSIYFKCVFYERGCRGRAVLRHHNGRFRETQPHNHPPDPNFVEDRHFRENLVQNIRAAGRVVNHQEILDQFRSDRRYTRKTRSNMTLARLRTTMYNAKMAKYPKIRPYTLRELSRTLLQHGFVAATIDEAENLYAGSITATDGSHHLAFFSPRMLHFMGQIKIIHGDGTFKSRPTLPASSQIFALVTTWNHCVIPLGWFLMESRTKSAYTAVFGLLKHICPALNPNVIMSDWEMHQQQAWQEAFPNAQLQGCLWHLCRALVKKAKELGLLRFKDHLPSLLTFIKQTTAIALLPVDFFDAGLRLLRRLAFEEDVVVSYLLEPFFDYFSTRWINNRFRRDWMSLHMVEHRTNNACESHNRMLRAKVGPHRPNVYLFIQALATLEHNSSLDIELHNRGGNARRTRSWKSVCTDRRLRNLGRDLVMDIFHDMDDTLQNFLERASVLFQSAFDEHVLDAVGRGEQNQPGAGNANQ